MNRILALAKGAREKNAVKLDVYEVLVSPLPSPPPRSAPAATIWRCANTVSSSTGNVTISAAAASGPQLSCSNESML